MKRVVRSILAAEAYAVSEGVEHAIYARHLVLEAMGQLNSPDCNLPITVFTATSVLSDSRTATSHTYSPVTPMNIASTFASTATATAVDASLPRTRHTADEVYRIRRRRCSPTRYCAVREIVADVLFYPRVSF